MFNHILSRPGHFGKSGIKYESDIKVLVSLKVLIEIYRIAINSGFKAFQVTNGSCGLISDDMDR